MNGCAIWRRTADASVRRRPNFCDTDGRRLAAAARLELFIFFIAGGGVDRAVAERLLEAVGERARRMMAAAAQELIARGDFDEDGDVPAGRDRHADERDPEAENLVERIVEPEPFVLTRRIPAF